MEASEQSPSRNDLIAYEGILKTENGQDVRVGVIAKNAPIRTDRHGTICVSFIDARVIDFIAAQVKELIGDGFDCIIMITGRRRIGKSNLAIQIARKVDEKFSIDSVAFHIDDFRNLVNTNPHADPKAGLFPQVLYDEAGFGLFSKDWMHEWVKEAGKCLQVVGKKQNIIYFILPHAKKLVGDIRDEMAYFWIDLDFKYKHERGYGEIYTGLRDKFKQLIWWVPKCCFKFDELADDFWVEYEKRKDAFIDAVAAGKYDAKSSTTNKDSERLGRAIIRLQKVGIGIDELTSELDMGRATIYRRIAECKQNQKQVEP